MCRVGCASASPRRSMTSMMSLPIAVSSGVLADLQMLLEPGHELDQVAGAKTVVELVDENAVPGIAAGARRARQGEQIGAAGDTAGRPALDRRGPDLLIAQHAENLAEAGDFLLVDGV